LSSIIFGGGDSGGSGGDTLRTIVNCQCKYIFSGSFTHFTLATILRDSGVLERNLQGSDYYNWKMGPPGREVISIASKSGFLGSNSVRKAKKVSPVLGPEGSEREKKPSENRLVESMVAAHNENWDPVISHACWY
jgi:hypothetical protein